MQTMIFDRYTQFTPFTIFEPRWNDKRVLLAKDRIGEHNKVKITQKHVDGSPYFPNPMYISGKDARLYKVESNGTIDCYCVPLEKFKTLIISEHSLLEVI